MESEALASRTLPSSIGPYKVLDLLGRGGMGLVYRAQSELPRRIIAVKVMRSDLLSEEGALAGFTYFLFLVILLTHRAFRDDARCRSKYGSYWEKYCAAVPYKIVPYVLWAARCAGKMKA